MKKEIGLLYNSRRLVATSWPPLATRLLEGENLLDQELIQLSSKLGFAQSIKLEKLIDAKMAGGLAAARLGFVIEPAGPLANFEKIIDSDLDNLYHLSVNLSEEEFFEAIAPAKGPFRQASLICAKFYQTGEDNFGKSKVSEQLKEPEDNLSLLNWLDNYFHPSAKEWKELFPDLDLSDALAQVYQTDYKDKAKATLASCLTMQLIKNYYGTISGDQFKDSLQEALNQAAQLNKSLLYIDQVNKKSRRKMRRLLVFGFPLIAVILALRISGLVEGDLWFVIWSVTVASLYLRWWSITMRSLRSLRQDKREG